MTRCAWERQLLSWQTLKIKQGSHGGHGEHREKTEENSWDRLQVDLSLWEGPRNAWERLGTPTFKLACSKESSHGDHEGHKEERYLGELTPGLCFLCALCVLCAKHLCFFEKTCRTKVRRSQPALPQNLLSCYNNHIFLRSFLNWAIGLLALRGCRFITSSRSSYNRRNCSTSGFFHPDWETTSSIQHRRSVGYEAKNSVTDVIMRHHRLFDPFFRPQLYDTTRPWRFFRHGS